MALEVNAPGSAMPGPWHLQTWCFSVWLSADDLQVSFQEEHSWLGRAWIWINGPCFGGNPSHCNDSVGGSLPTALRSIQVALLSPTTAPEDSPKIPRSPPLFLEESHRRMASRGGGVLVGAYVVCRKAWAQPPIVNKPGMVNEHLQSSSLGNGNRKIRILCNLTFVFIQTTSEQTHQPVPRLDVTDHVSRWCHSRNYDTKGRLTACLASLAL